MDQLILTVNSGSSSIKTALYRFGSGSETLLFAGELEQIGQTEGRFSLRDASQQSVLDQRLALPDHAAACAFFAAGWKTGKQEKRFRRSDTASSTAVRTTRRPSASQRSCSTRYGD